MANLDKTNSNEYSEWAGIREVLENPHWEEGMNFWTDSDAERIEKCINDWREREAKLRADIERLEELTTAALRHISFVNVEAIKNRWPGEVMAYALERELSDTLRDIDSDQWRLTAVQSAEE